MGTEQPPTTVHRDDLADRTGVGRGWQGGGAEQQPVTALADDLLVLGLDVGGTTMKGEVTDAAGTVLASGVVATPQGEAALRDARTATPRVSAALSRSNTAAISGVVADSVAAPATGAATKPSRSR